MFYSINHLDFLQNILKNVDIIQREFLYARKQVPELEKFISDGLPEIHSHLAHWLKENNLDWESLGYDPRNGAWGAFPVFKTGYPIKWYDAPNIFPETFKLINATPNTYFASFMRLKQNSITATHAHSIKGHLIFHVSLFDLDNYSAITCGKETITISKKGDYCLFDYAEDHGSANYSNTDRVNFSIDFVVPKNLEIIPMEDRSRIIPDAVKRININ